MIKQPQIIFILIAALLIVVFMASYYVLNAPDKRDMGDKIGDAMQELPNGTDRAARQLESRTPGEKLQDNAQDVIDDAKKATNQQ